MGGDFTIEQTRYFEGLTSGMQVGRLKPAGGAGPAPPSGPDAPHLVAVAKTEASGKKLVDQEKWKREEHPFDVYHRLKAHAVRMRIHNGILNHWQFAAMVDLAERCAGGYAYVTTRANLQLCEIPAGHAIDVIEHVIDLGLCSRGAGSDNIRNEKALIEIVAKESGQDGRYQADVH